MKAPFEYRAVGTPDGDLIKNVLNRFISCVKIMINLKW